MRKESLILALVLIMRFSVCQAPTALADSFPELQSLLLSGKQMTQKDAEKAAAELAGDSKNPYKRLVTGEVLANLGLYDLAAEQYKEADRLSPGYVLSQFKLSFESSPFLPVLLFPYLQEQYPDEPAILLHSARKNLQAVSSALTNKDELIAQARKSLSKALASPEPWPGTFALMSMLEFNDGKIDEAMKYCSKELKQNPQDTLARKVRILILRRQGSRPDTLIDELEEAVSHAGRDCQLNLHLGRAYILKHQYQKAIKPAILGLFDSTERSTLVEARAQIFELIKKAPRQELLDTINMVSYRLSDPGTNGRGFRSTVMRMRLADLFILAGDREEGLRQLQTAMSMHPHFQAAAAYRIGCELTIMHRYESALAYLKKACNTNTNPIDAVKYQAMQNRVSSIIRNYPRNLALQLKESILGLGDKEPEKVQ